MGDKYFLKINKWEMRSLMEQTSGPRCAGLGLGHFSTRNAFIEGSKGVQKDSPEVPTQRGSGSMACQFSLFNKGQKA